MVPIFFFSFVTGRLMMIPPPPLQAAGATRSSARGRRTGGRSRAVWWTARTITTSTITAERQPRRGPSTWPVSVISCKTPWLAPASATTRLLRRSPPSQLQPRRPEAPPEASTAPPLTTPQRHPLTPPAINRHPTTHVGFTKQRERTERKKENATIIYPGGEIVKRKGKWKASVSSLAHTRTHTRASSDVSNLGKNLVNLPATVSSLLFSFFSFFSVSSLTF